MSWFADRVAWLMAPWWALSEQQVQIAQLQLRTMRMEIRMTNAENTAYARAAEIVGLVRAEFESLRSEVGRLAAGTDEAVRAALAADSDADAARITGLIDELASVLPADVPDVDVPADGEPAELPDGAVDPEQPEQV